MRHLSHQPPVARSAPVFCRVGRSPPLDEEQAAPARRHCHDCVLRGAERDRGLGPHGGFRLGEGGLVPGLPGIAERHPPHDTLSDVMGDAGALSGEQVCVDGKKLRGEGAAVHMLGAYAAKARLLLAHQAVTAEKTNEIVARPGLLAV
jgi:hypothetical protein